MGLTPECAIFFNPISQVVVVEQWMVIITVTTTTTHIYIVFTMLYTLF